MAVHISTYTATNNLFSTTMRLQASYATASVQAASGLKSPTYEGIAPDAQRLLKYYADQNNLTGQALARQIVEAVVRHEPAIEDAPKAPDRS